MAMSTTIPAVLLSGICLALVWRHLGPVLLFVLGGHTKHRGIPAEDSRAPEPSGAAVDAFLDMGFSYLGLRTERFLLWGRQALVFVRQDGIIADLPSPDRLAGTYLATFWKDDRCLVTKAQGRRDVSGPNYRSVGAHTTDPAELLAAHFRNEQSLAPADQNAPEASSQQEKILPATMEERLALAEKWWQDHRKAEMAQPALIGALLTAGSLALWVYGLWYLATM